jgi:hypothetical protein
LVGRWVLLLFVVITLEDKKIQQFWILYVGSNQFRL